MDFIWPLINDNITFTDRKILSDFLLSNQRLTNGSKVKEFENKWSNWLGVKKSTMLNSGNSGNFISIAIVKHLLGQGEIIVPAHSWVSDVSSITQLGMTPVFVDISLNNLAINYENIKKSITSETKAIVLVHCLGFNAINDDIINLAKENNLILIEDCCEAHGATYKGQKVGSFGDISIFSFYFGHHMTTIEGGMICFNDEKLNDLAIMFRSHGFVREASDDTKNHYLDNYPTLNPLFTFGVPGFNMRSTELNAVLGMEQLKKLDDNIKIRKQNLLTWLSKLDPKKFYTDFNVDGNSSFALPLIIKDTTTVNLSKIMKILNENKVEYRLGMAGGGNQVLQPYMKQSYHKIIGNLNNTDHVHHHSLYIGNHTEVTKYMILDLTEKLNYV